VHGHAWCSKAELHDRDEFHAGGLRRTAPNTTRVHEPNRRQSLTNGVRRTSKSGETVQGVNTKLQDRRATSLLSMIFIAACGSNSTDVDVPPPPNDTVEARTPLF